MPLSKPIGHLEQSAVQCLQGSITLIPQGWQLEVCAFLQDTARAAPLYRLLLPYIVPVAVQQEAPGLPRPTAGPGLDQADTGMSHSPLMPAPPAALSLTPGTASPSAVDAPTLPRHRGASLAVDEQMAL
jgi:hypothetical protein